MEKMSGKCKTCKLLKYTSYFQKDTAEAVTSPTLDSFQDLSFSNTKTLVFVIQGGSFINDLDTEAKLKDFETFERVFTTVCHHNYPGLRGGVHFELIDCQSLTNDILDSLKELNIFSHNGEFFITFFSSV